MKLHPVCETCPNNIECGCCKCRGKKFHCINDNFDGCEYSDTEESRLACREHFIKLYKEMSI